MFTLQKKILYPVFIFLLQASFYSLEASTYKFPATWSNEAILYKLSQTPAFKQLPAELSMSGKILLFLISTTKKVKTFLYEITMPETEEQLKTSIEGILDRIKKQPQKNITEKETQKLIDSWNKLKSLYLYTLKDRVLYPFRSFAPWKSDSISSLERIRKTLLQKIHPDKCPSIAATEVSTILIDMSKPSLPLDGCILYGIYFFGGQLTKSPYRLVNIISPNFFKSQREIRFFEKLQADRLSAQKQVQIKKSILNLKLDEMKIMNILSKK